MGKSHNFSLSPVRLLGEDHPDSLRYSPPIFAVNIWVVADDVPADARASD